MLTWLLHQRPAIYRHTALSGTPQAGEAFGARWPAEEPLMAGAPMRAAGATGQQVVPVRFPAEQHAQLRRAWWLKLLFQRHYQRCKEFR